RPPPPRPGPAPPARPPGSRARRRSGRPAGAPHWRPGPARRAGGRPGPRRPGRQGRRWSPPAPGRRRPDGSPPCVRGVSPHHDSRLARALDEVEADAQDVLAALEELELEGGVAVLAAVVVAGLVAQLAVGPLEQHHDGVRGAEGLQAVLAGGAGADDEV